MDYWIGGSMGQRAAAEIEFEFSPLPKLPPADAKQIKGITGAAKVTENKP